MRRGKSQSRSTGRSRPFVTAFAASAFLLLAGAASAGAQQVASSPRVDPEMRLDATIGRNGAAELGAGVQLPAGVYSRVGVIAAAGILRPFDAERGSGAGDLLTGRLDVLARFLLDPYRQSALGVSAGAGLTLRAIPHERVRPRLLVAIEVEGRRRANGIASALQIGLGDGLRVGGVLRRGSLRAR